MTIAPSVAASRRSVFMRPAAVPTGLPTATLGARQRRIGGRLDALDERRDEPLVELACRRRPRAGAAPRGRRAPCGTGASSSSPRTRRRPRGSGRSAGSPRPRGGRGSRRRPSARGGGGCRPGSTSMSGRSRTIMSPSATCCWTIASRSRSACPACAGSWSGMPILPTSWSRPAIRIDRTISRIEPRSAPARKSGVPGDVLGMALRVAVLRVDRDDEALEDVEPGRSAGVGRLRAGDPDRRRRRSPSPLRACAAADASSTVTDEPCSGYVHSARADRHRQALASTRTGG